MQDKMVQDTSDTALVSPFERKMERIKNPRRCGNEIKFREVQAS